MTREEAEMKLIRRPCPNCKTTKWIEYSISLMGIIGKKDQFSSSLTCKRCNVPCGSVVWEGSRKEIMNQ